MKKLLFIFLLITGYLSFANPTIKYGRFVSSFGSPLLVEDLEKYVSSPQGFRKVISKESTGGTATSGKFHNAIDYAVPEGTEVLASKDGWIEEVYPGRLNGPQWKGDPVYGGKIVIKHFDGTETIYAHLSKTLVKEYTEKVVYKQSTDKNGKLIFNSEGLPIMSKNIIYEHTYVSKGDIIGLSGGAKGKRASGISTGPHLHFEIILNIEDFINYDDLPE